MTLLLCTRWGWVRSTHDGWGCSPSPHDLLCTLSWYEQVPMTLGPTLSIPSTKMVLSTILEKMQKTGP